MYFYPAFSEYFPNVPGEDHIGSPFLRDFMKNFIIFKLSSYWNPSFATEVATGHRAFEKRAAPRPWPEGQLPAPWVAQEGAFYVPSRPGKRLRRVTRTGFSGSSFFSLRARRPALVFRLIIQSPLKINLVALFLLYLPLFIRSAQNSIPRWGVGLAGYRQPLVALKPGQRLFQLSTKSAG